VFGKLFGMFSKKKAEAHGDGEDAPAETPAPAAEGEDGEAPPKKKIPLMFLIAGGVGAVVVLGGGGTAAFLMFGPHPAAAPAAGEHAARPAGAHAGGHGGGHEGGEAAPSGPPDPNAPQVRDGPDGVVFYTLPDIVVNMQTAEGRPTFLKLKLTFELPDRDTADALTPGMPRLRDMFQTFLRELRPEDLSGSQGSFQLRQEIQRRVNLVIAPNHVNAVLIEEMLIN
jgi:flagellar FliL protein